MRKRLVKDEFKDIEELNSNLFEKRIKKARKKKSPPFQMKELDIVLNSLKPGKSKDPEKYVAELFKGGAMEGELKISLLMMMNKMKQDITIPESLRTAHITILDKRKSKLDLNNWRGIFVCSLLRKILMKLVHERTYEIVSDTMTDSQIGAKRNKSVRNHLFVLNSIISDVMSSKKKEPIDLNIMDFKQMFDAEELPTVLNALYEAGVDDDMLALTYEANKNVTFAVKMPSGLTKQTVIRNKIMQGDVMSPLMSSNMVDRNIARKAVETKNVYMYKGRVEIPPLIMQDDTLSISTCGFKTTKINNLLNTRTNIMGLQFGKEKCVKMHIGKTHNLNICTDCEVDSWKDIITQNEDGEEVLQDSFVGKEIMKNVNERNIWETL